MSIWIFLQWNFFDDGQHSSSLKQEAIDYIRVMSDSDVELFLKLFKRMK